MLTSKDGVAPVTRLLTDHVYWLSEFGTIVIIWNAEHGTPVLTVTTALLELVLLPLVYRAMTRSWIFGPGTSTEKIPADWMRSFA